MGRVVARVGRPGGRVMATTYELTTEDLPLRLRQAVWSEQVDGFGATPRDPSLASLHANPAHSALRRARCFDLALHHLGVTQSRYYPLPWDDRYCEAAAQAAMDASEGYDRACDAAMWSVR